MEDYGFVADQIEQGIHLPAVPSWHPEPCPVCSGDCSSANPPFSYCPMRDAALTTTGEGEAVELGRRGGVRGLAARRLR
ncbi:hypothetical protein AB5I41_01705 [Sphingomonas sp. MMS24-JH45]